MTAPVFVPKYFSKVVRYVVIGVETQKASIVVLKLGCFKTNVYPLSIAVLAKMSAQTVTC